MLQTQLGPGVQRWHQDQTYLSFACFLSTLHMAHETALMAPIHPSSLETLKKECLSGKVCKKILRIILAYGESNTHHYISYCDQEEALTQPSHKPASWVAEGAGSAPLGPPGMNSS